MKDLLRQLIPILSDNSFDPTRRLTPIFLIFVIFLLLVIGRILYLQVVMGDELKKQSQVNRIRHEILPARRGPILDRSGTVLAADEPVFNLRYQGRNPPSRDRIEQLADGLNLAAETFVRGVREAPSRTAVEDLTDDQRIWFAERADAFPHFKIQTRLHRVYRFGSLTASVLGYTGEINPSELHRRLVEGLYRGKFVGKAGVEKYYDSKLQGNHGLRWVETAATGERIRVLDSPKPITPKPGDSLTLTLDLSLQKVVARSFPADSTGAVVVIEIPSGNIRALYSQPSYDPNKLVSGTSRSIDDLLTAPGDPLVNRVIQSRFPPGSTFKIIPYLTALRNREFPPSTSYKCTGKFKLGDQTFKGWKKEGHGRLALDEGLIHSCNIYFYKLVQDLGYKPVRSFARELNFETPTGVDLPGEVSPQLSTPKLKKNLTAKPWVGGDAINAIIGQGYTLISPIKQAQLFGSILSGKSITPTLKKGTAKQLSSGIPPIESRIRKRLIRTLDRATDEGTGYWAQHKPNYQPIPVDVIGKTGTVQSIQYNADGETLPSDAWFVSAAPRNDPSYVVVVFRSEAGTGGDVAAPHARKIYREMEKLGFFRSKLSSRSPPGQDNLTQPTRNDHRGS